MGDLDLQLSMAFLTNGLRPAHFALATDAAGHTTVTVAPDDTGARREQMLWDACEQRLESRAEYVGQVPRGASDHMRSVEALQRFSSSVREVCRVLFTFG